MAAVRIIGISYVLSVFIGGFTWLHSESTAAASTQSFWEHLSGMSTYEQMLIKPMGNDARTHFTDTVEGAAEVSVPFNPSPFTVHSAASSLTHGIPLSPEASSSEPQSFQGTVQGAVAHPRDPHTKDQQLSSDETVPQRSVENLLGSSEILMMNPNSLSVYAGLLHPSEDSLVSNAGALHSREDAAVSGTEEFVRNHASSVVGTEMLRAPPQTSSLDDSVIDARPQRTVQPSQEECLQKSEEPRVDLFSCQTASSYFVHYTLLCDHTFDCPDASDESFCTFDKCPQDKCRNGQCFEYNRRCDGSPQCLDSSDETCLTFDYTPARNLQQPVIVEYSIRGVFTTRSQRTLLKSYPVKMLRYLSKLKHVWANDFKMCCQAALPEGFDLEHCHAPQDNIASCDDLLRSAVYRSFLWIIAVFAMIGNTGSFVARLLLTKELRRSSFGLFVLNLSISDFLMGVYLTMIGVADQTFRGQYWWRVDSWKNSAVCKIAGFLSLLSSEVSAFFICLITIDRFLVLRFPFSRLHFEYRSTLVACVFAWVVGLVLAGVPLLPLISQWDFYGQTGICLPLPFTSRGAFSGYFYSFGVMIVLNFVLFMLIAIGQVFIYWSVRTRHKSELRKHIKSSDVAIARRLIAIVLSDFMCWFPIGILGLWAFTDNTVNSDINVRVAIFVMPFNAALNPLLYTLNLVMDKRRKAAEARMMLRLQATMHSEIKRVDTVTKRRSRDMAVRENRHLGGGQELPLELHTCPLPKLAALNQVDSWLKDGTLSPPEISSLFDATKMYMQKD
ncbi:hypothetical protein ACOMHN_050595 [Nucella lapillus]